VIASFHASLLCLLLAAAAASDVAARRIPNALPLGIAVLGIASQVQLGGVRAALLAAGAAALVFALLLFPWSRRTLGGGDVKLAAACAAWTGWEHLPAFFLATAVVGGLVSMATAVEALRRATASASGVAPIEAARPRRARVPYSVAIAAGAVIALQAWWRIP
jgi:prepilin peptidase CpaA